MSLYVVVHPRFGDTARVASDERHRPQLVADIGTGSAVSIQIDDEPGSTELAARFARSLAAAALRFAQRCEEAIPGPSVALPVMCGEVGTAGDL
ncbi:MAG: hypothetical protein ACRDRA_06870 [Pseudonocardiaceae bacterium]